MGLIDKCGVRGDATLCVVIFLILNFQYEQDYINIDFAKFAITYHFYTPISKNRHKLQQNCIWLV